MIKWSLSAELLSFLIIMMLTLFCYDKQQIQNKRMKLFRACLWAAAASIALNVICVITIENYADVPYLFNMLLNSAYFFVSVCTCTMIAAYLFDLLLEHVYDKSCRTKALIGLSFLSGAYTLLMISNFRNGLVFWFDSQGIYHRGILNQIGYAVLMIELFMLGMCYFRNRASVVTQVKHVMYTLPPLVILLSAFQLAFPGLLLNGTIMVFAILIIFVTFQNSQIGLDSVTGIGNRKSFFNELCLRLNGNQQFQIILISLKQFSSVNKQFGYHKGDEFLYHIANWLEQYPHGGRAFRFANMTFAILCPYVNETESKNLLDQIEDRFSQSWLLGEIRYSIPACFGRMNCSSHTLEATQIMEMLTLMTEFAKQNDQKTVEYGHEIEQMFRKRKWMEELLRDSIEKQRFEVWYQPLFNCKSRQFESAEALIRLRDYEGRLISPNDFIPLAEENGSIEDIGWFVWEEVCRFLGSHPELPLKTVSLNMSVQQFMNPMLSDKIEDCLKRNGLSADRIKMEITERVVSYNMGYIKQQMENFSAKGLTFCVDDFGTGYSNFSTVMHLPFEFVKLDRSLLETLTVNSKDQMIVHSLIELFHSMDLKVVAEGIETQTQQELICSMDADFIQGFYYAKPMPADELLVFLEK